MGRLHCCSWHSRAGELGKTITRPPPTWTTPPPRRSPGTARPPPRCSISSICAASNTRTSAGTFESNERIASSTTMSQISSHTVAWRRPPIPRDADYPALSARSRVSTAVVRRRVWAGWGRTSVRGRSAPTHRGLRVVALLGLIYGRVYPTVRPALNNSKQAGHVSHFNQSMSSKHQVPWLTLPSTLTESTGVT